MTNLALILINIGSGLLPSGGVYFLLKKHLVDAANDIKNEVGEIEAIVGGAVKESNEEMHEALGIVHRSVSTGIANARESFDRTASVFHQKAEEIKAHSKQVLDVGINQAASSGHYIAREVCAVCKRVVYKFQRNEGGTVTCLDCLHR